MRLAKIVVVGIIGLILGLGLWRFNYDGYSEKWERLSIPPQKVTELIPMGDPPLFIKISDGNTYYYSDLPNGTWIQKPIAQGLMNPSEVTNPCDFSFPEFSQFSNAPENVSDCIQEKTMYADGYIKYAFAVDSGGNIWEWHHTISPEDLTSMFCIPSSGLLIGLLAGFAFANMNNAKKA